MCSLLLLHILPDKIVKFLERVRRAIGQILALQIVSLRRFENLPYKPPKLKSILDETDGSHLAHLVSCNHVLPHLFPTGSRTKKDLIS
jgi:hypothetical protein